MSVDVGHSRMLPQLHLHSVCLLDYLDPRPGDAVSAKAREVRQLLLRSSGTDPAWLYASATPPAVASVCGVDDDFKVKMAANLIVWYSCA